MTKHAITEITEKTMQALTTKRGLNAEVVTQMGWQSYADPKSDDWICIPYTRAGVVVGRKYRRVEKVAGAMNFFQDEGSEQCLYNLDMLMDLARLPSEDLRRTELIITEGEIDCLTALQCGYNAVSVPNGAPAKPIEDEDSSKFDYLKDIPEHIIIVIAVDKDDPGRILQDELVRRLGAYRCKIVNYPRGCKDLNEVFLRYGRKGVDVSLKQHTKFAHIGGVFRMNQLPMVPDLPTYETGIDGLNDRMMLRGGCLIVVTGIPGHGKTTMVNELCCNAAKMYGWTTCFGSFEQTPRIDHERYLRTYYLGKPDTLEGGYAGWSNAEVAEADEWVSRYFSFIVPEVENADDLITVAWVLERIEVSIVQHNARIVVVDPWNELDHDRPAGWTETDYVNYAIKQFKRLARKHNVTIIIVAHPSKLEKNSEGGYNVPSLYDIAGSANWYNKCDIGIIVHRFMGKDSNDQDREATLIRIAKVRYYGILGKPGDYFFEFSNYSGKFFQTDVKLLTGRKARRKKAESDSGGLPFKE